MAREVRIAILGDSSNFSRAVRNAQGDAGRLDGAIGRVGSSAAKIGKAAAIGLAGGAAAVGLFAKSAIDAGSDLNESLSKSNTVFKSQALAIETFADNAAKNIGLPKQAALEAASSFGNMFIQLGIGEAQASGMSQQMALLAADFASFHNADITDVLEAQQAAFRGEYDSVQKFVPTINAAAVEQKALAMTGKKATKELNAQEKALAVQALMMSGAGDAVGDFARTSDGLANKQRIMAARFQDVKAKLGQGLIPIALKIGDIFLNSVLPAFEKVGGVLAPLGKQIGMFIGTLTSGFTEDEGTPIELFALKVREFVPQVIAGFQKIIGFVQQHWPTIQAVISQVATTIQTVVSGALSIVQTLWQNFGDNIWSFVQRVWPPIQQTITGVMNIIQGVIKTVTALIKGDWSAVWDGIKQVFRGVWGAIQGILKTALEQVRLVLGAALEVVGSMFKGAWNGIVDFFKKLPGRLASIGKGMFDFIKDAFKGALNFLIRGWNNLEFKIPGFDPPGPGPKFKGFTLGLPDIPTLHSGTDYFRPPGGAREGYALLERGERVTPAGQNGVTEIIQVVLPGVGVIAEAIRQRDRALA